MRVTDANTNAVLGEADAELVNASLDAAPTGIVAAYEGLDGLWHYVSDSDVDHYRKNLNIEVIQVYVEECT